MAFFAVLLIFCVLAFCGCAEQKATYTIEVSGTAESSGVIRFLDYSINVWTDEASNPCGDCADQPVHLFAGATSEEIAQAIVEVIERADNIWEVESIEGSTVVLKEKDNEKADDIGALTAPEGVVLNGTFKRGNDIVSSASGVNTERPSSDAGTELTTEEPERLGAVYGPSYEMLKALGVEEKIVVRADVQTDSFPWASKVFTRIDELPQLDNVHSGVSFEELMKYNPDLVFSFPRQNEVEQLEEAGIAVVEGTSYEHIDDTCKQLKKYAAALGEDAVEKADEYCAYFNEKLAEVKEFVGDIPENEKKTVYYAGTDILTTYGNLSDMVETIEAAGGKAVMADLQAGARSQINYEQLAAWNPDYIFLDHGGINDGTTVEEMKSELLSEKNYSILNAVKNNNVYTVPSGVFYWDMGLQKVLLVEYIAKTLYPEQTGSIDMVDEVKTFYEKFFDYTLSDEDAQKILDRQSP